MTHAGGNDAEYVLGSVITNVFEEHDHFDQLHSGQLAMDNQQNSIYRLAFGYAIYHSHRKCGGSFGHHRIDRAGPHNLAEESLDILRGERAMGDWVLEVRDHRVGPDDSGAGEKIDPTLVSWYIKIIGSDAEDTEVTDEKDRTYTRDDTADSLENGKKSRGKIVENETNYWTVETCEESTKLTIELSSIKKRNNAKRCLCSPVTAVSQSAMHPLMTT